jgi:broad specificity phosphatase PhoE
MRKTLLASILLLAGLVAPSAAQQTVFVVRHAERADGGQAGSTTGNDPDLSEAGRARAASLATALKDAKIAAIFTTELKRTQQTAAPLAKVLGVTPTIVPSKDTAALVARVKTATGNVLVVGHSNTIPEIAKGLGVSTPIPIADADYDNLFVLSMAKDGPPAVLQLHYR